MRLIDADALDISREQYETYNDYSTAFDMIDYAPTIKIPQWIPCSERLPEYYVCVLTWDGSTYNVEQRIPSIRGEDGEPIQGEWWVDSNYDEYESDVYTGLRDGAAIAWMPLPEPYEP